MQETQAPRKPTAVVGFGVTGRSVAAHLRARGQRYVLIDTRPVLELDAAAQQLADDAEACFWGASVWPSVGVARGILSPGLALDSCLVRSARAQGVTLISDIDLFFECVQVPVIGITGTNGKSTVTSLAGALLEGGGVRCGVGGNLGEAALELLDEDRDAYVLELSSFQLERSAEQSYAAAVILNLSEDHLDQHGDMAAYAAAKQRIYTHAARVICNRHDRLTWPAHGEPDATFGLDAPPRPQDWGCVEADGVTMLARGDEVVLRADEVPLLGTHNLLNVLAACALVDDRVPLTALGDAIRGFRGLAHRFERIAEHAGVLFVNDSKATNLGATVAALAALPRSNQVVLIAGGDAKGVDLAPLGEALTGRVKAVVALGRDGPAVAAVARAAGVAQVGSADDMRAAVRAALTQAAAGDMVLLSPACASLDMFPSYRARGRAFVDAVDALAGSGEDAHG